MSLSNPNVDLWKKLWKLLDEVGEVIVVKWCKGRSTEQNVIDGRTAAFLKAANDHVDHFVGRGSVLAEE